MFRGLVNPQYFREAALDFKKNKNIYCKAPEGSGEYLDYWAEQTKRCLEGYSVGDVWIPGKYYFQLNFCPMDRVPDKILKQQNRVSSTVKKIMDFPMFTELDFQYWNYKDISWNGGTFDGVTSPGGQHMVAFKTRGCGFSYKDAAEGVWNYNFIPGSKSYYFAALSEFLTVDGILNKADTYINFLNKYTQNFWYKNQMKHSTTMHHKSSYLDAKGIEHGYMSEIIGTIINDPGKLRGKRGIKLTFEEAGSFPRLAECLSIAEPLVTQGGFTTGQITVFGTAGEEGIGFQGLEDLFTSPAADNFMEFPNIWKFCSVS